MSIPRPKDAMRATLAMFLVLSFNGALAALFVWVVPEENVDLVNFMLGQLSILTAGAVGFYINTSKSSSDKNDVIAGLQDPHMSRDPIDIPSPTFGGTDGPTR